MRVKAGNDYMLYKEISDGPPLNKAHTRHTQKTKDNSQNHFLDTHSVFRAGVTNTF